MERSSIFAGTHIISTGPCSMRGAQETLGHGKHLQPRDAPSEIAGAGLAGCRSGAISVVGWPSGCRDVVDHRLDVFDFFKGSNRAIDSVWDCYILLYIYICLD